MNFFETKELIDVLKSLEAKPFNTFQTIESIVGENTISRMVSYFLGSEWNHGMGLILPTLILKDLIKKRNFKYSKIEFTETESRFNWTTNKGRFIDIVTVFKNERDETTLILGIETKIWAGEQANQLGDYQSALAKKFPDCPTAMIFLSPSGYFPRTALKKHTCAVFPYDYVSFAKLILKASQTPRAGSELLKQLGDQMKTGYTKSISEADKAKIADLWENHRESLEKLVSFGRRVKTPRYFLTELMPSYLSSIDLSEAAFLKWANPLLSAIPWEYNFVLNDINGRLMNESLNFEIYYMICNKLRAPAENSSWDIRLMAYLGNGGDSKVARAFAEKYAKKSGVALNIKNQWSRWICLELGDQIDLGDFSRKDAERIAKKFREFEKRTYKILITCL